MRFDVELGLPSASASFRVFAASDVGAVRRVNEDSFRAAPPVFLVADGMGGHNYGDQASQQAVATFADAFEPQSLATAQQVLDTIRSANAAVISLAEAARAVSGTTLAGVALVELQPGGCYHWMIFNVGDSRVYRWDGRTLGQLTVDHSVVQELVDAGRIAPHEAATHPERNVITRALGASEAVDPDVWLVPVSAEDTFLICSDGLTRELDDREIARFLAEHTDGEHEPIADRLVRAAVAAGGSDNVTVVVVESSFRGVTADSAEDTVDRYPLYPFLEDTRPRP